MRSWRYHFENQPEKTAQSSALKSRPSKQIIVKWLPFRFELPPKLMFLIFLSMFSMGGQCLWYFSSKNMLHLRTTGFGFSQRVGIWYRVGFGLSRVHSPVETLCSITMSFVFWTSKNEESASDPDLIWPWMNSLTFRAPRMKFGVDDRDIKRQKSFQDKDSWTLIS